MFRFKTLRKNSSSDVNSREDNSSRVLDEVSRTSSNIVQDRDVRVDDPLVMRLNHQRQLNEEKNSRTISKSSEDFEREDFMGWDHAEKDPFDLGSTSSDEEDTGRHEKYADAQENPGQFLGWGDGSYSSLDEIENEKPAATRLVIASSLSRDSSNRKFQQQPFDNDVPSSSQHLSERSNIDDSHSFMRRSDDTGQLNRNYVHHDVSIVLDTQSTLEELPLPTSSIVNGMMRTVKSHSNLLAFSLNQGEVTPKPLLQSNRLDQSSDRSHGTIPSIKGLSRRPTFMNIFSGSMGISASIKVGCSDTEAQSQTIVQSCTKVHSNEEEEESPRLQQLKEQSVDELQNEMSKMQVQAQHNLERSWAEAERIRRSNDEVDEMISNLKVKLAEAKATPTVDANQRYSPSQDSYAMASTSEIIHPSEKVPQRSFSSAAFSLLLGNNNDFYDENTQTVMTKIKSDPPIKRKSKARRRRTFMSEFSSGFGIGPLRSNNAIDISHNSRSSDVGMSIDGYNEQFEGAMSPASSYLNQSYDYNDNGSLHPSRYNDDDTSIMESTHVTCDYDYFFSPDDAADGKQKSRTGNNSTVEQDTFGVMRSAIESVYSGTSFLQLEEQNIFHAEATALMLEDLNDQLTQMTEDLSQIVVAVQKQQDDIEACRLEIDRVKSDEEVKKLEDLEKAAVLDLNDFNRCFRSLDGKLQSIESISFDIKTTLDESKHNLIFEDVRLDEKRLLQVKDIVCHDSERLYLLEMLNDALAFCQYYESRERIMSNILQMDFLEADLWNQLVKIRLCIEQVVDEEGTQTTESSMASERRALERVFIESILPQIELAQLTKNTALCFLQENIAVLKWWNHLIDCMESFKSCHDVTPCVDFILNESSLSLEKDVLLLERVIHVTSETLSNIKSDVKQECKSFRSKVERAGLLFNHSNNEMSLDDSKQIAKSARALRRRDNLSNDILEKRKVLLEKDKTLKLHVAELERASSSAQHEIGAQLQLLEKMHNQVQIFTSKMLEQDSLLSSLKEARAKKEKKVIRLQKIAKGAEVF